jgi:2-(1,2-epoxy-1,2-dihydrophenyl)acetyl-CoA isomerase
MVPLEELMKKTQEFAAEIASSAPMAVESIRATVRGDLADQVEEIVDWELKEQIRLQSSDDFKEGIAASLERRVAQFNRS